MPLRKADTSATRKFEDGDAWLVLRTGGLTKGEADHLADITSTLDVNPAALSDPSAAALEVKRHTAHANRALFELLCIDWSLGEVSGEAYSQLDQESGEWVDECLRQVIVERQERAEKNVRSSKRPSRRASSSAKAAG